MVNKAQVLETRLAVYVRLAETFGWTFDYIADLPRSVKASAFEGLLPKVEVLRSMDEYNRKYGNAR